MTFHDAPTTPKTHLHPIRPREIHPPRAHLHTPHLVDLEAQAAAVTAGSNTFRVLQCSCRIIPR